MPTKWYAVARGRQTGVFNTWKECQTHVHGFAGAVFKSFTREADAQQFAATPPPPVDRRRFLPRRRACTHEHGVRKVEEQAWTPPSQATRELNEHLTVQFDGGSRGNPGIAGWGCLVIRGAHPVDGTGGTVLHRGCGFLGKDVTNNVAEYAGCYAGILAARALGAHRIHLQGDSKLVLEQLKGTWRVRHPGLADWHRKCQVAAHDGWTTGRFTTQHLRRALNTNADKLANTAMDNCITCLPTVDEPLGTAPTSPIHHRNNKKKNPISNKKRPRSPPLALPGVPHHGSAAVLRPRGDRPSRRHHDRIRADAPAPKARPHRRAAAMGVRDRRDAAAGVREP